MDVMGYDEARETVKENIEYCILSERYPVERLDEIVDIASEALCSKRSSFSLGKDTYPYALVKDRLLRLDGSHIISNTSSTALTGIRLTFATSSRIC